MTVIVINRVDSDAVKIVADDKVDAFLNENNPILNPDGTEWGSWVVGSVSGLTQAKAETFCDFWQKRGMQPEAA